MFMFLFLLLIQITTVVSNTEKAIFVAPQSSQAPPGHPSLEDFKLETLSLQQLSLRTYIQPEFPTSSSPRGQESWFLLDGLNDGQRYEVRICWAATEPTSFRLDTYELSTVFSNPELLTSLARFSGAPQTNPSNPPRPSTEGQGGKHTSQGLSSTLFLHVHAAADYYTTNKTLIEHPPPVHVDVILDPFLYNVLPASLLPTAGYIVLLAILSWPLSGHISKWLQTAAKMNSDQEKKSI